MPLHIITEKAGIKKVYKAGEAIAQHCVVYLSDSDWVKIGDATNRLAVIGVVDGVKSGGIASGDPVRVMQFGVVSGPICDAAVLPGDRVIAARSGRITPLVVGGISGYVTTVSGYINLRSGTGTSGDVVLDGGNLACTSGIVSGVAGYYITVQPTLASGFREAVIGRALVSGGAGSGIQLLVTLGG